MQSGAASDSGRGLGGDGNWVEEDGAASVMQSGPVGVCGAV